jgi:hypothetical protein
MMIEMKPFTKRLLRPLRKWLPMMNLKKIVRGIISERLQTKNWHEDIIEIVSDELPQALTDEQIEQVEKEIKEVSDELLNTPK